MTAPTRTAFREAAENAAAQSHDGQANGTRSQGEIWMPETREALSKPVQVFRHGEISLKGLRLELRSVKWNAKHVDVSACGTDRDSDQPINLGFTFPFSTAPESEAELAAHLLVAVTRTVSHEFAERLFLRGRRVFDPHNPQIAGFLAEMRRAVCNFDDVIESRSAARTARV